VEVIEKRSYYEQLLNSAFNTQNISFINQFYDHSLTRLTAFGKTFKFGSSGGQVKKRIIMLQRSRSATTSKLKFLVLVPVMMGMLTLVACSDGLLPKDSNLESYSYTLVKGQEKSSEANVVKYENFLN